MSATKTCEKQKVCISKTQLLIVIYLQYIPLICFWGREILTDLLKVSYSFIKFQNPRWLPIMVANWSYNNSFCYIINYFETTSAAINIPKQTVSNTDGSVINDNADSDNFEPHDFWSDRFSYSAIMNHYASHILKSIISVDSRFSVVSLIIQTYVITTKQ